MSPLSALATWRPSSGSAISCRAARPAARVQPQARVPELHATAVEVHSHRQNVKEREGRRLGRRAAWNNAVFWFYLYETAKWRQGNLALAAEFRGSRIPETGTLASGMPGDSGR